jgi:hypothetical protein
MEKQRWTRRLESNSPAGSRIILLAPVLVGHPFTRVSTDVERYKRLLLSAQQLRGRIYVRDSAIKPSELSLGGRHIQPADAVSWHLLTIDQDESVTGCLRYHEHNPGAGFSELGLSRSSIVDSREWGHVVRAAIQAQIVSAARRKISFVELGGWAISEKLRRRSDAVRMILSVYALARMTGGALAVTTATERHNSASILRRMGGSRLSTNGVEVPPYYDPRYGCEMEMLTFDSTSPGPYEALIADYCTSLSDHPVILPTESSLRIETPGISVGARIFRQSETRIRPFVTGPTDNLR